MSMDTDLTQDVVNQRSWLELNLQPEIEGQEDGSVMVRWCVPQSQELAMLLKALGITKPYVLLVIRPFIVRRGLDGNVVKDYQGESLRKLVPLVDEATYVSFARPGPNEILACIVGNKDGKGKYELGGVFTFGGAFSYYTEIFEYGGELVPGHKSRHYGKSSRYEGYILPDSADIETVDVPKDMFAPEYPKWRTDLVSKFHRSKTKDQCNMFWRTVRSMAASLFYFPFAYLARTVQLVLCLWFAMRGINLRGFLHPIQGEFNDVISGTTTSFWFKDMNRRDRSLLVLPLNPVSPVITGFILWGIGTLHVTRDERVVGLIGWEWWQYFVVTTLGHLGIFVLMLVVMALVGIISAIVGTSLSTQLAHQVSVLRQSTKKAKANAAKQRQIDAQKALEKELYVMACSEASRRVSLDALPKQKQTLRLRVAKKKSKSCKPIAR